MKHHQDRPLPQLDPNELKEATIAIERLHEIEKRATWEACARAFGHNNEMEMWRKYEQWQRSNDPEAA